MRTHTVAVRAAVCEFDELCREVGAGAIPMDVHSLAAMRLLAALWIEMSEGVVALVEAVEVSYRIG